MNVYKIPTTRKIDKRVAEYLLGRQKIKEKYYITGKKGQWVGSISQRGHRVVRKTSPAQVVNKQVVNIHHI